MGDNLVDQLLKSAGFSAKPVVRASYYDPGDLFY